MLAKKCDRCGSFYEVYNTKNDENKINGIKTFNINPNNNTFYSHRPYDLCPKCSEEFMNWLHKENK